MEPLYTNEENIQKLRMKRKFAPPNLFARGVGPLPAEVTDALQLLCLECEIMLMREFDRYGNQYFRE